MEIFYYRKSRIWELKEDKYSKSLAKTYGDAMFVSLSVAQIWLPETNRNICS